jgi:hypothetical protein
MKNKKYFMSTKQIYIGLVVFMLGVFVVGAADAQPQQHQFNQGLLSKLIEIKYTSELYLSSALKQGSNKDSALANYNTLRWKLDGFVYQLSADMIAANSPRKMILLNAWCLEESNDKISKKKIQVYTKALTEIENFYQNIAKINLNNLIYQHIFKDIRYYLSFYSKCNFLYIGIDGVPSVGKMIEQQDRRYKGYLMSLINKQVLLKHKTQLYNKEFDMTNIYNEFEYLNMKISFDKNLISLY